MFWNLQATKILLAEVKKRDDATQKGKNTKKKMWIHISEQLDTHGYKFSWEQVMGKWKTLVSALKKTEDHNNRSGSDKKSCAFQRELEDILGGNPTIKPTTTSGTKILNTCNKRKADEVDQSESLSNDNDKEADPVQPPKTEKMKRRSGSSAEVLDFLKQYMDEQKNEREEEKTERARMHDEKMNMFKDLIKEMKK